jgi:hypothetical protein
MTDPKNDYTVFPHSLLLQINDRIGTIHSEIGELKGQMEIVNEMNDRLTKFDNVSNTVERLEPLVDSHEKQLNRSAGSMDVGKWFFGAISGIVGAGMLFIAELFFPWKH